ncbi:hypothetical protein [Staphylococcus aureus]
MSSPKNFGLLARYRYGHHPRVNETTSATVESITASQDTKG